MSENIRVVVDADATDYEREMRRGAKSTRELGDAARGEARAVAAMSAAAEQAEESVRDAGRAHKDAERQVEAHGRAESQAGRQVAQQGRQYAETAREIDRNERELEDLTAAQRAARRSNEQTEQSNEELERSYDGAARAARTSGAAASAAGARARQTVGEMGRMARRAAMVGGALVAAAGWHVMRTGMDYEQQMARVQGVISATADEMRMLDRVALKLGADTKFSASESAAALYELGAAGFDATKGAEALPGVLALAAASGIELADAADISAGAVFGFGLAAEDTQHVADVLAKVANTTAVEVRDLQYSMKYIAPVAQATGQSLEEMAAALGVMGEATIRGEQAGTSLRGGLLRLVNPTKQVRKGLREVGMEASDLYGDEGLLPLPELIGRLKEGTDELGASQRAQALAMIFGTNAVSGMLTLVDAGPERLARLTRGYEQSTGSAAKASKIMNDTVEGALEQFTGAVETQELLLYKVFQEDLQAGFLAAADIIDREGRIIQRSLREALESPEFDEADWTGKVRIIREVIEDEWRRLDIGDDIRDTLVEAFNGAIPLAAEAAAEGAGTIAVGVANGFLDSNVWGRLVIGTWLFSKFGGFAAMRAAGVRAGSEVSAGMAAGLGGAGAAGGAISRAKGWAATAGRVGLYTTALFGGIEAADIMFSSAADEAQARLEQLDDQGSGMLGTLGRLTRSLPDIGGMTPGRDWIEGLADGGDDAHRLLEILEDIDTVGKQRAEQLQAEGAELLRNLNLTKEQREEIQQTLDTPDRARAQARVIDDLGIMRSGALANLADIEKLFAGTMRNINEGWRKGSKGWREAVGQAMDAQIEAVRQAYTKQGKITERGAEEVRRLTLEKLRITGEDPFRIADAIFKSWRKADGVNKRGINQMLNALRQMPVDARRDVGQVLLGMVRDWEKKDEDLEGSTRRLRSALTSEFRGTWRALDRDQVRFHRMSTQGFEGWKKSVLRATGAVREEVSESLSWLGWDAPKFSAQSGGRRSGARNPSSGHRFGQFRARGGMQRVAGQGYRDTVAITSGEIEAMVAPGEDLAVINRHQRPMLDLAVNQAFGVSGLNEFFGTYNRPHYLAEGGFPRGGFPDAMGALPGLDALAWILQRQFGLGATSGLRPGAITTSGNPSDHGWGGAIDVSNGVTTPQMDAAYAWLTSVMGGAIKQILYRTMVGGNHYDHIHVALQEQFARSAGAVMQIAGGNFAGMADIGQLGKWEITGPDGALLDLGQAAVDQVWEAANEYLSNAMPSFAGTLPGGHPAPISGGSDWQAELSQIAQARGWDAAAWMELVMRESSGDPTAVNPSSGAFGLGQFLGSTADAYAPYGAKSTDPVRQIQAMARYIADRYGTPSAALGHHDVNNWYAGGGLIEEFAAGTASISATKRRRKKTKEELRREREEREERKERRERRINSAGVFPNEIARHTPLPKRIEILEGHLSDNEHPDTGKKMNDRDREIIRRRIRKMQLQQARKEREKARRLKRLEGKGIPGGMLERDARIVGRIDGLDDTILQDQGRSTWHSSEDGVEQSEAEIENLVKLHERKLAELRRRRKLLKSIRQHLRKQLRRVDRQIRKATPRRIKKGTHWVPNPARARLEALRTNRANIIDGIDEATMNLREVAGHNEKGGGAIFDTRSAIVGFGAPVEQTESVDPVVSERDSEIEELLRQQLHTTRQEAALGQAQFGVLQEFLAGVGPGLPYIGAFAQGTDGKRVGRTGLAVLHKDEMVTTDPAGPFGSQLPPAKAAAPVINLYADGDIAPLLRRVRAEVDGRAATVVDREIGRKARQLSVAPGR